MSFLVVIWQALSPKTCPQKPQMSSFASIEALQVLKKAFELFPRLGRVSEPARRGGDTTVFLRAWSSNIANRMQYHNEAMKCCRVSIRDISKRRALWHDQHAGEEKLPQIPGEELAHSSAQPRVPQPSTPPAGR